MRRYTTPTTTLFVPDIDLSEYNVYVTFTQGTNTITIDDPEITVDDTGTTLSVYLTQAQTGQFKSTSDCQVQVNWITETGRRNATQIKKIMIDENLLQKVVEYE